jgi:hypothetical protein
MSDKVPNKTVLVLRGKPWGVYIYITANVCSKGVVRQTRQVNVSLLVESIDLLRVLVNELFSLSIVQVYCESVVVIPSVREA